MERGDRFRFFDGTHTEYMQTGDVGDNDIYFMPATVVNVYKDDEGRDLVDVVFDHKSRWVSAGHFPDIVKEIQ